MAQALYPGNEDSVQIMRKPGCRVNPVLTMAFINDMKILVEYETVGVHSWYGRVFVGRHAVVLRQ